jgi:hypothetical protein
MEKYGGYIHTSYLCRGCHLQNPDEKPIKFSPIGSFISALIHKLALYNPDLRPMAEYYHWSKLPGSGGGSLRYWPYTIIHESWRKKLKDVNRPIQDTYWYEYDELT